MAKRDGRKGPMADFWRAPADHPLQLCRELSLHPFATSVVCTAARDRIMRDNGLTMDDLFPLTEPEPEDAGLFEEPSHA